MRGRMPNRDAVNYDQNSFSEQYRQILSGAWGLLWASCGMQRGCCAPPQIGAAVEAEGSAALLVTSSSSGESMRPSVRFPSLWSGCKPWLVAMALLLGIGILSVAAKAD